MSQTRRRTALGPSTRGWLAVYAERRCGCSSMVEHQLPKLNTRVRFPSSAPSKKPQVGHRLKWTWGFVFTRLPTAASNIPATNWLELPRQRVRRRHRRGGSCAASDWASPAASHPLGSLAETRPAHRVAIALSGEKQGVVGLLGERPLVLADLCSDRFRNDDLNNMPRSTTVNGGTHGPPPAAAQGRFRLAPVAMWLTAPRRSSAGRSAPRTAG